MFLLTVFFGLFPSFLHITYTDMTKDLILLI